MSEFPMKRDEMPRSTSRPNIVMIVLDDSGFGDFGCYGSEIATPHIDGLARRGLRYNRFHVTPLCSPTRACLMTGRNHHAVGMGDVSDLPRNTPGYTARLPPSAATLPQILQHHGYSTFAVGKWHLTPRHEQGPSGPFVRWPLGLGFERFYGFLSGATNQWTPDLVRDNTFIEPPRAPDEGYHLTEDLAEQAIKFVCDQQQAMPDKPFFLYFATGAMHSPHQVWPQWSDAYRGQFDDGWDVVRARVFAAQRSLGVVPRTATLTPRPPWIHEWNGLSEDERRVFSRQREVYAGFLTHTDAQIGRIIDHLERTNALANTIVLVLSDNGSMGSPTGVLNRFAEVNDLDSMAKYIEEFGGFRANNDMAWGWGWVSNTPFKLMKAFTWLGGVRVPLVVHWPGGILPECQGEIRDQVCHAVDIMPTLLDAAGIPVPDTVSGVLQQPVHGESFLKTLNDTRAVSQRRTQYFEVQGSRAIYHDGWKATTNRVPTGLARHIDGSSSFESDQWSLYCLDADFSEAHDLASTHPGRLGRMIDLWWREAERNQVLPLVEEPVGGVTSSIPQHAAILPFRDRYVVLSGGGHVETPPPFTWGFEVTAEIVIPEGTEKEGVICAHHLQVGGWQSHAVWACYLLSGRLLVTFNTYGMSCQVVVDEKVAFGDHRVEISCLRGRRKDIRVAHVLLDGVEVANATIGRPPPDLPGRLWVGRDGGFPVSGHYRPPFFFKGKVESVTFRSLRRTEI